MCVEITFEQLHLVSAVEEALFEIAFATFVPASRISWTPDSGSFFFLHNDQSFDLNLKTFLISDPVHKTNIISVASPSPLSSSLSFQNKQILIIKILKQWVISIQAPDGGEQIGLWVIAVDSTKPSTVIV